MEWHKESTWLRAGDPDVFGDGTTYRIFERTGDDNSPGYDLWVWSGPREDAAVLGMHGSDLRSQKRAKRLGWYPQLTEAQQAAAAFDAEN